RARNVTGVQTCALPICSTPGAGILLPPLSSDLRCGRPDRPTSPHHHFRVLTHPCSVAQPAAQPPHKGKAAGSVISIRCAPCVFLPCPVGEPVPARDGPARRTAR